VGENWFSSYRRLELDPSPLPCTKMYSKYTKDLNLRPAALKLLEENISKTLEGIGIDKDFLNRIPKAQEIMIRTEKCDYIK
jgi:hypothetical protein